MARIRGFGLYVRSPIGTICTDARNGTQRRVRFSYVINQLLAVMLRNPVRKEREVAIQRMPDLVHKLGFSPGVSLQDAGDNRQWDLVPTQLIDEARIISLDVWRPLL